MSLNGFVDGVFVYRGYAEKGGLQGDWVLVDLPVNLVNVPEPPPLLLDEPDSLPLPPPRALAVGECDALAARPDDPTRPQGVMGVSDDDLKAGQAAEICEEALAVEPDNPRLLYQLARAYLLFGKAAEGVEAMIEAAEQEHAVAIASLGDFVLYGLLDDDPDPETAKALYLRAAEAGFKPAAELAEMIQANPEEDDSQEAVSEPIYIRPDYAAIVLSGSPLRGQGVHFIKLLSYSSSFISGIKYQCPDLTINMDEGKFLKVVFSQGFAIMAFADEQVQQEGMDDGYALAVTKGCHSREVLLAKTTFETTIQ